MLRVEYANDRTITETTFNFDEQDITETEGATVSQIIPETQDFVTGTLKTSLTGATSNLVILTSSDVAFLKTENIVFGRSTLNPTNTILSSTIQSVTVDHSDVSNFYKNDGKTAADEYKNYPSGAKYPTRYSLKLGTVLGGPQGTCQLTTEHSQFECTTAVGTGKLFSWRVKSGSVESIHWPDKNEPKKRTNLSGH